MTWALFFFGLFLVIVTPSAAKELPDDDYRSVAAVILSAIGIVLMVIATALNQIGGAQ